MAGSGHEHAQQKRKAAGEVAGGVAGVVEGEGVEVESRRGEARREARRQDDKGAVPRTDVRQLQMYLRIATLGIDEVGVVGECAVHYNNTM